ncbi:hypothetical protein DMH04_50395 [Kibdelosporangium aridum]|uniref:Uncharacterized protein n=1 Tax=Kibdelosporangium aridum TaxID=2030 RepID=A0A428YB77_KIBAR|nr:hypothetical protein DMH04_50395 [Kibdelosporangium aridum]
MGGEGKPRQNSHTLTGRHHGLHQHIIVRHLMVQHRPERHASTVPNEPFLAHRTPCDNRDRPQFLHIDGLL